MVDLVLKLYVLSLQLVRLLCQLIDLTVFLLDERTHLNESLFVLLEHLLPLLKVAIGLIGNSFCHSEIVFQFQVLLYLLLYNVLQRPQPHLIQISEFVLRVPRLLDLSIQVVVVFVEALLAVALFSDG